MEAKERRKVVFTTKTFPVLDKNTGELIEQKLTERIVTPDNEDINFFKIWPEYLTGFLNSYGNAKSKVFSYLLQVVTGHKNNTVNLTQCDIANNTNISLTTVNHTMSSLRKMDIIRYNSGEVMINPDFIAYGSNKTRNKLKERYKNF